jgi:hypothetical protein
METRGTVTIFLVIPYQDLASCKSRVLRKRVYREENVTQQQSSGLFADFKGMNPSCKGMMESTWCIKRQA